jgi:hypothetical protein
MEQHDETVSSDGFKLTMSVVKQPTTYPSDYENDLCDFIELNFLDVATSVL